MRSVAARAATFSRRDITASGDAEAVLVSTASTRGFAVADAALAARRARSSHLQRVAVAENLAHRRRRRTNRSDAVLNSWSRSPPPPPLSCCRAPRRRVAPPRPPSPTSSSSAPASAVSAAARFGAVRAARHRARVPHHPGRLRALLRARRVHVRQRPVAVGRALAAVGQPAAASARRRRRGVIGRLGGVRRLGHGAAGGRLLLPHGRRRRVGGDAAKVWRRRRLRAMGAADGVVAARDRRVRRDAADGAPQRSARPPPAAAPAAWTAARRAARLAAQRAELAARRARRRHRRIHQAVDRLLGVCALGPRRRGDARRGGGVHAGRPVRAWRHARLPARAAAAPSSTRWCAASRSTVARCAPAATSRKF